MGCNRPDHNAWRIAARDCEMGLIIKVGRRLLAEAPNAVFREMAEAASSHELERLSCDKVGIPPCFA